MLNFNDPVAQKDGSIKPLFEGSGGSEYSTEETVVGKWIDGSIVYQKTYVFDVLSDAGTYEKDLPENVKEIISIDGC